MYECYEKWRKLQIYSECLNKGYRKYRLIESEIISPKRQKSENSPRTPKNFRKWGRKSEKWGNEPLLLGMDASGSD